MKIRQTAKRVNNITGPVKITGTTATVDGKVVAQVGVETPIDKKAGQ